MKVNLIISIIPFIFNSSIILLSVFFIRKKAAVTFDGKKLCSDRPKKPRNHPNLSSDPLSERRVVIAISFIVAFFTLLGILVQVIS